MRNIRQNLEVNTFASLNARFKTNNHSLKTSVKRTENAQNRFTGGNAGQVFSQFSPYLETVLFMENETVYQPGDAVDYVYFPQSSVFSEFQILEDGATVEIAMTGSEGIVGLSSVLSDKSAINWTQVSVAGDALKIKSKILREEIFSNRVLQRFVFDYVNCYIGQISQRAVCNNCHTLEKRFCSWLLMLQDRLRSVYLPLTQEQLARILGAHRPSITNIAHSLRVAEIIDYRRGVIQIRNRPQLENRACNCYAQIDKNLTC